MHVYRYNINNLHLTWIPVSFCEQWSPAFFVLIGVWVILTTFNSLSAKLQSDISVFRDFADNQMIFCCVFVLVSWLVVCGGQFTAVTEVHFYIMGYIFHLNWFLRHFYLLIRALNWFKERKQNFGTYEFRNITRNGNEIKLNNSNQKRCPFIIIIIIIVIIMIIIIFIIIIIIIVVIIIVIIIIINIIISSISIISIIIIDIVIVITGKKTLKITLLTVFFYSNQCNGN